MTNFCIESGMIGLFIKFYIQRIKAKLCIYGWLVLWNSLLSCYFKAHINIEIYSLEHVIKYIHKTIWRQFNWVSVQLDISQDKIAIIFKVNRLDQPMQFGVYLSFSYWNSWQFIYLGNNPSIF